MAWKAYQKLIQSWKIVRGDRVMIIRGKDKGEVGVIKRVVRSQNRVIVEGKNLSLGSAPSSTRFVEGCVHPNSQALLVCDYTGIFLFGTSVWEDTVGCVCHLYLDQVEKVKKHIKQGQGSEGGILSIEAPLHVSNVQVVDPVTGLPCKIGIRYTEDGERVRVSRGQGATGSIIPRPEILKIRSTPRPAAAGPKDTPMDLVLQKTYDSKTGRGMPDL